MVQSWYEDKLDQVSQRTCVLIPTLLKFLKEQREAYMQCICVAIRIPAGPGITSNTI